MRYRDAAAGPSGGGGSGVASFAVRPVPAPTGAAREQQYANVQSCPGWRHPIRSWRRCNRESCLCRGARTTATLPSAPPFLRCIRRRPRRCEDPSINAFQTFWLLKSADAAAGPPDCDRIVRTGAPITNGLESIYAFSADSAARRPILLATSGANPATRNVVLDASRVRFDPNHPDDSFDKIARAWTVSAESATQSASYYASATHAATKVAAQLLVPPSLSRRRTAPLRRRQWLLATCAWK